MSFNDFFMAPVVGFPFQSGGAPVPPAPTVIPGGGARRRRFEPFLDRETLELLRKYIEYKLGE